MAETLELETFLPYRLSVLASVVSQGLATIYARRYGFGIPEWRVMATLGQFGAMTAKEVGGHSRMHKTKVSRAVAALESRSLVARRENRKDRREAFLSLTAEGRSIYDDLVPVALGFADEVTSGLTTEERDAFDHLIAKLTAHATALRAARGARDDAPD